MSEADSWRRCNACKQPIPYGAVHQVCSVSTCNRARTGMVFCSVSCWEVHLPSARHREAWAVEKRAPASAAEAAAGSERTPRRRSVVRKPPQSEATSPAAAPRPPARQRKEEAVLVIASRMKDYVREQAGFNTSDRVLQPLSRIVRRALDEAIENARRDERKTVLDRDVPSG